jgi:hypothetical protein
LDYAPCFNRALAEFALPASVLGPVERAPLMRADSALARLRVSGDWGVWVKFDMYQPPEAWYRGKGFMAGG